jgi:phenylalanyl-tRNA synthetase beta chain
MPVVNISLVRLKRLVPGVKTDKALDMLPFIGLDIEGIDGDRVRVEYNPNRPDFSSDYGIARALAGLLGKKTGMPRFRRVGRSGVSIGVDKRVKKIRPFVVALVATNGRMDDETIKQIIAMQEDLHNGPGRRRKKASIGIHNLDAVKAPLRYTIVKESHSFAPLGSSEKMTVRDILEKTPTGHEYGHLLAKGAYPAIIDSNGTTLSFPPIINGEATKVDTKCRNLLVEVTATDRKTADDVLAIVTVTLADAGFEIRSVSIVDGARRNTPEIKPAKMSLDADYVNEILGLELSPAQMAACLKKCRLDAKVVKSRITCTIPRYRTDIFHPIDLAEEVAVGYGFYNIQPTFPASLSAGQRSEMSAQFDAAKDTMTSLGMIEAFNFSLSSRQMQHELAGRTPGKVISVDGSKSAEHDILRDSVIPSLLQTLARNVHEEYPQRLFEIGKAFRKDAKIEESWHIAAVVAHGQADYTEIKSILATLLKAGFGSGFSTKATANSLFIKGRCAEIRTEPDGRAVGIIGEITPLAIDNFKLRVPVAAFEVDLSALFGQAKPTNTM